MPETTPDPAPPYDRDAIFHPNGPFNPSFMRESVRALFRTLPIDPDEPQPWADRRRNSALLGLSALHPRDEIEVMLGVQAMSAYHAAAACFRIGMNLTGGPNGHSTRHITAACSAARAFDTMLRAIERRQAKPLAIPVGRPAPRIWDDAANPSDVIRYWEEIVVADAAPCQRPRPTSPNAPPPGPRKPSPPSTPTANASASKKRTKASTSPTPKASSPAAA